MRDFGVDGWRCRVRSEKRKRLKVESRKSKRTRKRGGTAKARRVDDRDEGLGMKE